MHPEWKDRVAHWIRTLEMEFYEPLGEITLEGFTTMEMLSPEEAERGPYAPMPRGAAWGKAWEYCWLRGDFTLPPQAAGQRVVMNLNPGGEATLFLNGEAFGTRRAEWIRAPHHFISDQTISLSGQPGTAFHLLMEAYAGHDYPMAPVGNTCTGPLRGGENDYAPRPESQLRQRIGECSFGIWHEEAYQLWLDAVTLRDLLEVTAPQSLRASEIEEALENFTKVVDFELPRAARLREYAKGREALRLALQAKNGTVAPLFTAIGNAHLDLSWLWPYRETQRKVARTFAAQVRLMDMYPEYKYLQSQPQAYQECKELYPELYEKIKEKIRQGQWIADGAMWVEPDTNMPSGEALCRQLLYGKLFYQKEFGVDCQLLWLPDTFGYSAVLPQLLQSAGVKYLTTQKIFWSYNDSDRFPYHYFTWQGMDGTRVTSFLHMDYTSDTRAHTLVNRWQQRVQRRGIHRFLLPFGYGDGGGGPTRDDLEFLRREKDLQGAPRTEIDSPQAFFGTCEKEGGPRHTYVGELYFQCHRGTYTSQAAVKKGNRKSELALREAEIWRAAAAGTLPYPQRELETAWKKVLLNQFHDILPGSSIGKVYEEAAARYREAMSSAEKITREALNALAPGEGTVSFNSLSWSRTAVVDTPRGLGLVKAPPMGWTDKVSYSLPDHPVSARETDAGIELSNGLISCCVGRDGALAWVRDGQGRERLGGRGNELRMYQDIPRKYDAWDIDSNYTDMPVPLPPPDSVALTEEGPFRCAVTVRRRLGEYSSMEQTILLNAESSQVDFITRVDWHERHRLLKAAFSTGIQTEEAINEIQYGFVRRPTHRSRPYDADRFEVCNHHYTALCDGGRGAAGLNDSKYGVSMLGDEIALTLLRAPVAPDGGADQGVHEFVYSYYIWDGPFIQGGAARTGYELNVPLRKLEGGAGEGSLLSLSGVQVMADAVKRAEDGSGALILRLYECCGAQAETRLSLNLPWEKAWEADLLERPKEALPCQDGTILLSFHPFEVKTLRIE